MALEDLVRRDTRRSALSLIAGGVLAGTQPAVAQTPAPVPVRIGSLAIDPSAESYYGDQLGIFTANGIVPQITTLTNGAAITAAVVGGDLDAGLANPLPIAAAISRGIPLQMIAPACLYSTRNANANLVVAKDSPVRTPKELVGATIGVGTLGDFNQLTVMAYLEKNGVARDAVQYVEIRFGEVGQALQRGTVKAAFITEPFKSDAVRAGLIRDFADTYLAVAPEIAVVVWFASKSWLQRNPDAAKRLVGAIYATARYANTHFPQTAEILARVTKIDPATVAKMVRAYYATTNDKKYVQDMLTLATRYGLLQRPVTFEEYSPPLQTA